MQFSSDGKNWKYESNSYASFNQAVDRAAQSLGIKGGELIYWRQYEGGVINKSKWRKR